MLSLPVSMLLSLILAAEPATQSREQVEKTIHWDHDSLHLVAAEGHYGRIIRLKDGSLVAGYSRGSSVWSKRSDDGGKTWGEAVRVGQFARGTATNSELVELRDGRLMYLFNERDARRTPESKAHEPDNGIAIAFSSDGGKTWGLSRRIYGGGPMWEPAAIERGKQLAIFFADEKPYDKTNEQQISMLVSRDGGKTWQGPTSVSFRAGHRDGMPVPALLADGRPVIAIEDDGLSGTFKPVIVDLTGDHFPVGGKDRERCGALAHPLPAGVYAGAPYLIRLGNEATVLSAQVDEGDGRKMAVWVGDAGARGFSGRSSPFAAAQGEQLWNSLLALDDGHILAIAGATINGKSGVWTIEGQITP